MLRHGFWQPIAQDDVVDTEIGSILYITGRGPCAIGGAEVRAWNLRNIAWVLPITQLIDGLVIKVIAICRLIDAGYIIKVIAIYELRLDIEVVKLL